MNDYTSNPYTAATLPMMAPGQLDSWEAEALATINRLAGSRSAAGKASYRDAYRILALVAMVKAAQPAAVSPTT